VAINVKIMTLFIWHLTATTVVVLAAYLVGGFGLRLAIALIPLVMVFGRFERPRAPRGRQAPAWRYVLGALMTVNGLALLAAQGVGGHGRFGLNVWGLALALVGIGVVESRIGALRDPGKSRG